MSEKNGIFSHTVVKTLKACMLDIICYGWRTP